MGASNDHPSPLDFKYRLQWYIMKKHSSAIFTENRNSIESKEFCLLPVLNERSCSSIADNQSDDTNAALKDICISQQLLVTFANDEINATATTQNETKDPFEISSFVEPEYLNKDVNKEIEQLFNNFEIKEKIHNESLKYSASAGFVA